MSVDPNEIAIWTRAWAISRNCPPPAPAFGGWFVDVGLPDQASRYVFAKLNPVRLRTLGAAIREPFVLIKHPTNAAAVQAALGPDWDAVRTGWFMRTDLTDEPAAIVTGFAIEETPGPARQYRMTCPRGEEAARARLTIIGAHAIIDSVDTEPAFRRRGLASALMGRLAADPRAAGAKTGLLTATDAGLMVYERLGWTVLAPWTTAKLKGSA